MVSELEDRHLGKLKSLQNGDKQNTKTYDLKIIHDQISSNEKKVWETQNHVIDTIVVIKCYKLDIHGTKIAQKGR